MYSRSLSCVFLSSILFCTNSSAAVFQRDWLAPGDDLITFDNVNQREWLDLSETILDQFSGATLEDKFQSVLTETLPGGIFEDFIVAKGPDTEALAISAGIDINTGSYAVNSENIIRVINLLGITIEVNENRYSSAGAIDEVTFEGGRIAARFSINDRSNFGFNSEAGFSLDAIGELGNSSNTGVMLYRNVPEPCLVVMLMQVVTIGLSSVRSFLHLDKKHLRMLATFTVNSSGDFIDTNPNITTLREAIEEAGNTAAADIINFALSSGEDTIQLSLGELKFSNPVTIDASGNDNNVNVNNGGGSIMAVGCF